MIRGIKKKIKYCILGSKEGKGQTWDTSYNILVKQLGYKCTGLERMAQCLTTLIDLAEDPGFSFQHPHSVPGKFITPFLKDLMPHFDL